MNLFSFIGDIFKPAADLVDNLHTSDEERLALRIKLESVQNELMLKVLDYEKKLMEVQGDVIKAEATGGSWIQRNWRPITMLTFLVLVVLDSFRWLASPLAPEAWTLLQIGLGGYVVGRSVEKSAPSVVKALKGE